MQAILVMLLIVTAYGFSCHIEVDNKTKMNEILDRYKRLNRNLGKLSLSPWTYENNQESIYEAKCDSMGCSRLSVNARAVPIFIETCVYQQNNRYNRTPEIYKISVGCTCIKDTSA